MGTNCRCKWGTKETGPHPNVRITGSYLVFLPGKSQFKRRFDRVPLSLNSWLHACIETVRSVALLRTRLKASVREGSRKSGARVSQVLTFCFSRYSVVLSMASHCNLSVQD